MSERKDRRDWSERRPAEGVRIIRAEEAQAALDAGEAAGRRPDDELRFGDVPPAPQGPRPQHRFPLPDSVDPASAVPRPPLAVPVQGEDRNRGRRESRAEQGWTGEPPDQATAQEPWDVGERTTEMDLPKHVSTGSTGTGSTGTGSTGTGSTGTGSTGTGSTGIEPGEAPWAKEPPTPGAGRAYPVPDLGTDDTFSKGWEAEPAAPWAEEPDRLWAGDAGEPAAGSYRAETPWDGGDARKPSPAHEAPDAASMEPGINAPGAGGTDLPHWSDPPTGEVPKILIGDADEDSDDLAAWRALGTRGTRWRDSGDDWEDLDELGDLADLDPEGGLNQTRTEHSDLYSFDEDFERVEAERTGSVPVTDLGPGDDFEPLPTRAATVPAARSRHTRSAPRRTRPAGPNQIDGTGPRGEDLPSRVVVGLGLIILLIICYAIGSTALVVLATVIITAAAAEAYGMLQRSGFRPATLLGLVGTVGVCLGAYWKGLEALPLVTVLVFGGAMLWYLLRIVEARPLANVAVTAMTFVWVAVLGSYAALMLRAHHGKGLFLGAVVVAVAADIAAFLVGRWIGNKPMAPEISPGKTVEGFIGGLVAAVIVGAIVGKELTPWGGMKHGLLLGVIVGLIAPAGDLFESMIKRDLGVKDSGSLLAGHGGLLDRFDSLLVVLPAAFYVATLFSIVR